jgi:serine phosphatase RsbU (regulator of sigma subunit)
VAARYEAASRGAEVGGDFYDVVPLDEHRLTLIIGDVQGHDMTAATVRGELRSAIRADLSITQDPAGILGLLNEHALTQSWGRFATTSIAVIDGLEGTLEIASAGHPPPFLVGRGRPAEPLTLRPGILLGVSSAEYTVERLELPSPGALVFVTDGLIDEGRSDAQQRVHAFAQLVDRQWTGDPEGLADAMLAWAHADGAGDDRALLLAQWSAPWPARTSGSA